MPKDLWNDELLSRIFYLDHGTLKKTFFIVTSRRHAHRLLRFTAKGVRSQWLTIFYQVPYKSIQNTTPSAYFVLFYNKWQQGLLGAHFVSYNHGNVVSTSLVLLFKLSEIDN